MRAPEPEAFLSCSVIVRQVEVRGISPVGTDNAQSTGVWCTPSPTALTARADAVSSVAVQDWVIRRPCPIELEADNNGTLLVICPALPEVTTFGENEADAIEYARDAIEEA